MCKKKKKEGHTAAATTRDIWYLGTMATVMDAEMLGIAMGWSKQKKVATGSQGGIGRIMRMRDDRPRSWIEELVIKMQRGGKEIVWVKAHSGIPGNEYADYKAREAAYMGSSTHQPQTSTPAGIRQHFCVHVIPLIPSYTVITE